MTLPEARRMTRPGRAAVLRARAALWIGVPAAAAVLAVGPEPQEARGDPPAADPGANRSPAAQKVNPDGFTTARVCGSCHEDIYASWKSSMHAFSIADPVFDAAYLLALKAEGDVAKRLCLRCHAPITLVNEDYDLTEGVTLDGVSCDFCHTVTAVHLDDPVRPYSNDPGLVKRSVLKTASSPAHEVSYSKLHESSEFCAGCHNYTSASGAPILSTYDEWRRGPYAADGIQCQDCHMAPGPGRVVAEEVKKSQPHSQIHRHRLIHDTDQIKAALHLEIGRVKRTSSGAEVDVQVENVGSGHMIPTGIPSRELQLQVTAHAGEASVSQERSYRKVVADEKGRPLTLDHEIILYGARVLSDNRIGPGERRLERFVFDLPRANIVQIEAVITYVYEPMLLKKQPMRITIGQTEKVVH